MKHCYIDIESQSNVDLKKRGVHSYAYDKDAHCRITMIAYAFDNKAVKVIRWPKELPKEILDFEGTFVAHNFLFDKTVLEALFGNGKSRIFDHRNWEDTSAVCRRLQLPASLDGVSNELGFGSKDEAGKNALKKYFKVTDIPKDDYELIVKYCKQDLELLRKAHKALPPLSGMDREIFDMINDELVRGVRIDKKATDKLLKVVGGARDRLLKTALKKYGHGSNPKVSILTSPNLKHLVKEKWGLTIESFNKKTLQKFRLKNKDLHKGFLEMLELRESLTSNAYKKLDAIKESLVNDSIHDFYIYHGAHTGRPAGRNVQIQNFRKPRKGSDTFASELENLEKFSDIEIPKIVSTLARGVMLPDKGNLFASSDLSAIELRIALWIANSKKGLDIFRKFDSGAKGAVDIYDDFGANLKLPKEHSRQVSKIAILGLDYGSGLDTFADSIMEAGVNIEQGIIKRAFDGYHLMYPEIRNTHSAIMQEVFRAFSPKECAKMKFPVDSRDLLTKYKFIRRGDSLVIKSPSGRESFYHKVKLHVEEKISKRTGNRYTTYSMSYDNGRGRKFAHGASLFENMCQGLATEVFFYKTLQIHKKYFVSFTVHDEAVPQVKKADGKKALEFINKIMKAPVDFVVGCPFNAKSVLLERYYKQD